jgi:hypothetical protein
VLRYPVPTAVTVPSMPCTWPAVRSVPSWPSTPPPVVAPAIGLPLHHRAGMNGVSREIHDHASG